MDFTRQTLDHLMGTSEGRTERMAAELVLELFDEIRQAVLRDDQLTGEIDQGVELRFIDPQQPAGAPIRLAGRRRSGSRARAKLGESKIER